MNNLTLILDTGNFLFKNVVLAYRKSQKFKRGEKGGKASLKKFGPEPGFNPEWYSYNTNMLRNFMVECFTVAAVNNYDLQEKLKEVVKELTVNPDVKDVQGEFVKRAKVLIPQYNYTGEEPREGALRTNLRTAMTSAYHAGLWDKVQQAGIYRFLQYNTRRDDRVREEHQALEGKIYNIDDPVWQSIYPPNGWNCRCYTTPMTHDEMQETGYPPESLSDKNKVKEVTKQAGVSEEFMRNTGMTQSIWGKWMESKLKDIDYAKVHRDMKSYAKNLGMDNNFILTLAPKVIKDAGADDIDQFLDKNISEFRELDYTKENWDKEFGSKLIVETPLGNVKIGNNQFIKLGERDGGSRRKFIGLIKETLTDPVYVVNNPLEDATYFLRRFRVKEKGKNFLCVSIKRDNMDIIISERPTKGNEHLKMIKNGEILYIKSSTWKQSSAASKPSLDFAYDSGRFDRFNIFNTSENFNEVWGTIKPGKQKSGVYSSKVYGIKYGIEGFFVNAGEKAIPYGKLDDWRKGVIVKCSV